MQSIDRAPDPTPESFSRRRFLQWAMMITGAGVAVNGCSPPPQAGGGLRDPVPRLNPAFKIREIDSRSLDLYTRTGDATLLTHRFAGRKADLIRLIAEEKKVSVIAAHLASLHGLSVEACQLEIDQALAELEKSMLIYYGDKMMVKVVERRP